MPLISEKALLRRVKKAIEQGTNWWNDLSDAQCEWVLQNNKDAAELAKTWWADLSKKDAGERSELWWAGLSKKERAEFEKTWAATTKRNFLVSEAKATPAELELLRLEMKYGTPDSLAEFIGMLRADFKLAVTSKQTSTAAAQKPKPAWHAAAKREADRLIASGTNQRYVAGKIARMRQFSQHDIKTIRAALK